MKTTSHIVAGGGWQGTRLDRVKVKACIALITAMILVIVAVSSIGTILVYAFIPAVVSFIISIILFIRELPTEIESLTGRVGTDPSKLYGRSGCRETTRNEDNANKS
jgi:sensor histidine kinase YesM